LANGASAVENDKMTYLFFFLISAAVESHRCKRNPQSTGFVLNGLMMINLIADARR
jgi:hypothetical protein